MRVPILIAAVVLAGLAARWRASSAKITGDYVEARTAEVFAGGCIMSSEAETIGRQAVLAWRIRSGQFDDVTLDGLSVMAAVSGDRNLGIREIGGAAPAWVKASVIVDERATPAQRDALVGFVKAASGALIDEVVEVDDGADPVRRERAPGRGVGRRRAAGRAAPHAPRPELRRDAVVPPVRRRGRAALGFTDANSFSGRRSARSGATRTSAPGFVGTFSF